MSFVKFASLEVLDVRSAPSRVRTAALSKFADFNEYRTDDGYIYVRVRAISSRVNKNHDGWPSEELKKAYRTFIGKPIFVDHHNSDPKKARGVIVDAALHVEDQRTASLDPYYASAPENHLPPTWIELLLEVDAKKFPRLAKAIVNGDIDGVSMGANVEMSKCSHCGNEARSPEEFCKHIVSKGAYFDHYSPTGQKTSKKSYEDCYGVGFFEISFVFDPADETALVSDIKHTARQAHIAAIHNEAGASVHVADQKPGPQSEMIKAPQKVNTLRQEQDCPICGSTMEDGVCEVCFTPDTLVRVREGYVPIATVEVGDEVLSEDGAFHRVLEVMETPYNGLLYEITTHANAEPIRVTPQHPFKALLGNHTGQKQNPCRPGRCSRSLQGFDKWGNQTVSHEVVWIEAGQLTENSFVALNSPKLASELAVIDSIAVPEEFLGKRAYRYKYKDARQLDREYVRRGPTQFSLSPDFLWAVGMYLAEGSAGDRQITFALHEDEIEYQERLRDIFEGYGYTTRLQTKKETKGVWLNVHSSTLAEWFPSWLGSGCANKRIPAELINLPLDQLDHVIRGICDGDEGKTHQCLFTQTSPTLAMQVVEHSLRHGNEPTLYRNESVGKKTSYTVDGSAVAVAARPKERTQKKRWTWQIDEQTLVKVKSVKQVPYWGSVYNLRVEGDPTYTIQNILVHNCNYEEPPEGFDNPDLSKAKEVDQQIHQQDAQQAAQGLQGQPNDVMPGQQGDPDMAPSGATPAGPGVMSSSTSNYRASAAVSNENSKTSALNGGRINTQERPILPVTRQLSDKPIAPRVVQEAKKPVESNVKDKMAQTTKVADGVTPKDPGVQPEKRVDVEGVGGFMQDTDADKQVDVTGVGAVSGDPLSGIDHENVEKNTGDFTAPHTDTWSNGEGDSLGQHDPVTNETGDLFTVSHEKEANKYIKERDGKWVIIQKGTGKVLSTHDSKEKADASFAAMEMHKHEGGKKTADSSADLGGPIGDGINGGSAKDGGPTWDTSDAGFPDHQPSRVDLAAPLKEEVGEGTKTWSGTDGFADPITSENANELGGPIGVAVAKAKALQLKAFKIAETEIELGLTDSDSKFDRVSELESNTESALDAQIEMLARVKTAGLKKTAAAPAQKTAGRMPSMRPVTAAFDIEAHSVNDINPEDSLW